MHFYSQKKKIYIDLLDRHYSKLKFYELYVSTNVWNTNNQIMQLRYTFVTLKIVCYLFVFQNHWRYIIGYILKLWKVLKDVSIFIVTRCIGYLIRIITSAKFQVYMSTYPVEMWKCDWNAMMNCFICMLQWVFFSFD